MRRYWALAASIALVLLAIFGLATWLGWALEDPRPLLVGGGAVAAAVSVGLLTVDVVAPIPASLVMLANGWAFGAAVGSLVSIAGGMLSFALAFGLGAAGSVRVRRLIGPQESSRAEAMLDRHGALAVSVSRPLPILAETVALLAGASRMQASRACSAALVGVAPQAIAYALVGATLASFAPGLLAFVAVVAVSLALWLVLPRR